jgi:hypothetical protein
MKQGPAGLILRVDIRGTFLNGGLGGKRPDKTEASIRPLSRSEAANQPTRKFASRRSKNGQKQPFESACKYGPRGKASSA